MSQQAKVHLKARAAQPLNNAGQALGRCYTFGYVTEHIEKATCKNCRKRYQQEIDDRARR